MRTAAADTLSATAVHEAGQSTPGAGRAAAIASLCHPAAPYQQSAEHAHREHEQASSGTEHDLAAGVVAALRARPGERRQLQRIRGLPSRAG